MTDQLSMRFDPNLPNPPTTLRPMLARPTDEPFDSPDHLFEPSWGGARVLAVIGPASTPGDGAVLFADGDGMPLATVPAELRGLGVRVNARSAVLDGELVVVDGSGRADPVELERRLAGHPGRPVTFLVFDLLDLDGKSLLRLPLERRRDALRRVLRPGDEVLTVPAIPTEGRALFDAVSAQGLAGILARHRSSPYLPGVRSRLWRFVAAGSSPNRHLTGADGERSSSPSEADPGDGDALALSAAVGGSPPMLALIRRLPLTFDDVAPISSGRDRPEDPGGSPGARG